MSQINYTSESTENLIRRAQQILGEVPVINLANWQTSTYSYTDPQIKSLSPSCHSISVKNVITVTDSSIVVCTGSATSDCPASIPASCPVGPLTPSQYVNMMATLTASNNQTGIKVTFKYLLNDTPTATTVDTNVTAAGPNVVYAFLTNQQYGADTTLVLYGAEVTQY